MFFNYKTIFIILIFLLSGCSLSNLHQQDKLGNVSILIEQDDKNYKFIHYDFKTSDNICYEVKADFMRRRRVMHF